MRIATFNINYENVNLPDIVRAIRAARADVVLLQDTNARSQRFLRKRLAHSYLHMTFRGPGRRYLAGGGGILSRCKIGRPRFLRPKHGLFGACLITAQVNGHPLQLVNAHLTPLHYGAAIKGRMALLREVERVERIHKKEIAQILGALANKVPTVFAGDLNSLSWHHVPAALRTKGFVDSVAHSVVSPDSEWTWRLPGRKNIGFRVDYVFHTRQLRTVSNRLIRSRGSDHNWVVSEVWLARASREQR